MRYVKIQSDYSPGTFLHLSLTEDGDVVFKVSGQGEMRIAMSGGQLHGKKLVAVSQAAEALLEALSMAEDAAVDNSPCAGCAYRNC